MSEVYHFTPPQITDLTISQVFYYLEDDKKKKGDYGSAMEQAKHNRDGREQFQRRAKQAMKHAYQN